MIVQRLVDFAGDSRLDKLCADLISLGGAVCAKCLRDSASSCNKDPPEKASLVLDISWEKLHTGPWKDVSVVWRDAYSLATILSLQCKELTPETLREAIKFLDMAVIMGGPLFRPEVDLLIDELQTRARGGSSTKERIDEVQARARDVSSIKARDNLIEAPPRLAGQADLPVPLRASNANGAFEQLGSAYEEADVLATTHTCCHKQTEIETALGTENGVESQRQGDQHEHEDRGASDARSNGHERTDHDRQAKRAKIASPEISLPPFSHPDQVTIPRSHLPSLESFLCEHMLGEEPVIITGLVSQWPAFQRWQDLDYLKRVAGLRTVPVEVGETYVAEQWRQELMTLEHFIETHMEEETSCRQAEERGYLAQHPLFDQIPELRKDIVTPDYCSLGGGQMQSVNAWFGPPGTVTPLHYDPHHNLLAQVVGRKYIRLYPPSMSKSLYPHTEGMLTNTSRVDLDHPDAHEFPLFADAPFSDCILEPGDMLYIPPRWWHGVKSLSKSFSVSFWWAAEKLDSETRGYD